MLYFLFYQYIDGIFLLSFVYLLLGDTMKLDGLMIAHRGIFDNKQIPENSLLSFSKAIQLNYPIELDVQLTKDKQLVVFHDLSLERMCGTKKFISDLTLQELRNYSLLSTDEKIPSLQEVLDLVCGRVLLDIEVKHSSSIDVIASILLEVLKDYSGDVLLKSFQPNMVRYLKKHCSYPIGLLMTYFPTSKLYSYFMSSELLVQYTKADFIAVNKKIIEKKRIQKFRKKRPVFVWALKEKKEFLIYKNWADSFLFDSSKRRF